MSTWKDINTSEATEFTRSYWEGWYERELNASSDTCMHNHSSGVHEYLMRTRSKDATLVYICKHCLEIVSPLEPLADE
jgi:DNA-directed RNA polymerase subunit M/transcription elongation factor TFIIS